MPTSTQACTTFIPQFYVPVQNYTQQQHQQHRHPPHRPQQQLQQAPRAPQLLQQQQRRRPRRQQPPQLPQQVATTTTTAQDIASAYWPFDNNALELYNTGIDGTPSGSPTYTTSFLGYGAAMSLTRSSSQYVYITPTIIPFNSRSFTVEAWIYPISFSTSNDYGIMGQCQVTSTNFCFHFIVRNNNLYFAFYSNDLQGGTTLTMNVWQHVACVYDLTTGTQQVWLNGNLDGSRSASAYSGLWGITTIGATFQSGSITAFNGYIDNVRYTSIAKNSTEILSDANLQVYYSFDGGSLTDYGPNGINATAFGVLSNVTGRVNQAIQFNSGPYISYTYYPFYFLGVSAYSYTMALWAKPTGSYSAKTLVYVTASSGWCVHFVVTTSSGVLTANSWMGNAVGATGPTLTLNTWTHIGYTYSTANGVRLYINGNLYSSTGSFTFSASGAPMLIRLGGDGGGTSCSPGYGGAFTGALDEFYLYNRELTAAQIWALANP
ncbi:unnamed protein product [Rotaria magnacalcarata]